MAPNYIKAELHLTLSPCVPGGPINPERPGSPYEQNRGLML